MGAAGSSGSGRNGMDGLRPQRVLLGASGADGCLARCGWGILAPIFEDRRICGCLVCEAARYEVRGIRARAVGGNTRCNVFSCSSWYSLETIEGRLGSERLWAAKAKNRVGWKWLRSLANNSLGIEN
jgi:hypothetical protein